VTGTEGVVRGERLTAKVRRATAREAARLSSAVFAISAVFAFQDGIAA
jgi:hypothetical protein